MEMLPQETRRELPGDAVRAREARFRAGSPIALALPGKVWQGDRPLPPGELLRIAQALTGHALASEAWQLKQGFLPVRGGHRLGVAGEFVMGSALSVRHITSLCLRLAHEVRGAAESVYPFIRQESALVLGPPGAGKTTMLRDIARLCGLNGESVGIADERGELAACLNGAPQLDVGPRADVITGCPKGKALGMLLRGMAPNVLMTDELSGAEEARALIDARFGGARVYFSAHGVKPGEAFKRTGILELYRAEAFEKVIVLKSPGDAPLVLAREEAAQCE